ncbi:MAG: hypothetical protein ACRDRV_14695 [Pseudonocardiaceae bacterium]
MRFDGAVAHRSGEVDHPGELNPCVNCSAGWPGCSGVWDRVRGGGPPAGDAGRGLRHPPDFLPLIDECHRVLRPGGVLHLLAPWWRHVNAVADPTHLRLLDTQTIKGRCARAGSPLRWYPLHADCDGATVLADLTPLGPDDRSPSPEQMARFFD